MSAQWVLSRIIERDVGYTEKALEGKRQSGAWLEGKHWRKAPDGRIAYNLPLIQEWMAGNDNSSARGSRNPQ